MILQTGSVVRLSKSFWCSDCSDCKGKITEIYSRGVYAASAKMLHGGHTDCTIHLRSEEFVVIPTTEKDKLIENLPL